MSTKMTMAVLKKQILKVGGNVNGGYSVLVTGGITRDDKIAFPYGDTVKEGAATEEVSAQMIFMVIRKGGAL